MLGLSHLPARTSSSNRILIFSSNGSLFGTTGFDMRFHSGPARDGSPEKQPAGSVQAVQEVDRLQGEAMLCLVAEFVVVLDPEIEEVLDVEQGGALRGIGAD